MNFTLHVLHAFHLALMLVLTLAPTEQSIDGKIAAVSDDKIVIATSTAQRTIKVTPATTITLDGQPAKLKELPVRSPVTVIAEGNDDDLRAKSIAAMSVK
jgi:hypothetical protein